MVITIEKKGSWLFCLWQFCFCQSLFAQDSLLVIGRLCSVVVAFHGHLYYMLFSPVFVHLIFSSITVTS